ncbi:hypothetical protein NHX12_023057 [Muraenolepis orangiensis]|uniref:Uncharacterized protein n=1 Tax=Muraenolepis orangiensis TaxID=630683 RepID=A0A9Q0D7G3_9TELE|nr:hypothetical protein NHX12_023057 [Muraenolepis orangiensis]
MWITSTPQLYSVQTPRPGELKVQAQNSHEGMAATSTAVPATPVCTTVPVRVLNVCLAAKGGGWQLCGRSSNGVPVTWRDNSSSNCGSC